MKYFKCMDLFNYDLDILDIYPYKTNYKLNCLLNKKSIVIKTPKIQLQSNLNSGYIVIELNKENKKSENLINFIKKIEIETGDKIKLGLKKKYKLHSNFVNNSSKYIFKNNDKNLTVFDKNRNIIEASNSEIYSDIILLIKLQDIWINTEKRTYGLNWTIFQCRVFPQFDYSQCLLIDSDDDEVENIIKKELIVQKCVFCNSVCTYNNTIENINIGKGKGKGKGKGNIIINNNINTGRGPLPIIKKPEIKTNKPTNQPAILPPTANELISVRNKLKKMKKIVDSDSD